MSLVHYSEQCLTVFLRSFLKKLDLNKVIYDFKFNLLHNLLSAIVYSVC